MGCLPCDTYDSNGRKIIQLSIYWVLPAHRFPETLGWKSTYVQEIVVWDAVEYCLHFLLMNNAVAMAMVFAVDYLAKNVVASLMVSRKHMRPQPAAFQ